MWMSWLALFAAAFGGGAINAIAGGGTFLTFPVLLWLGFDPKIANATSTVALVPGALSSAFGYREQLHVNRALILRLLAPSLLGGLAGALLLLWTPSSAFARIIPFLILFATLLFALQARLTAKTTRPMHPLALFLFQLIIAVYGGYFGAGLGILLLAALGFVGLADIHQANGVKSLLGSCINLVAAVSFGGFGYVSWAVALWMAVGAVLGGYLGARLAKKVEKKVIRSLVIVIGLLVSGLLFLR